MIAIVSIENADNEKNNISVMILNPTREIAKQSESMINQIGIYNNIKCCLIIGGTPLSENERNLNGPAPIVSSTPGRTLALLAKGIMNIRTLYTLILDEADEMMASGFVSSLYNIYTEVPSTIQCCLIS